MTIEIVDLHGFTHYKMVIFHSYVSLPEGMIVFYLRNGFETTQTIQLWLSLDDVDIPPGTVRPSGDVYRNCMVPTYQQLQVLILL